MLLSWRWFGDEDPISLNQILQTGAKGIVSALHTCDKDQPWSEKAIAKHHQQIRSTGMDWVVAESVPVNEAIKLNNSDAPKYLEIFKQTIINLSSIGIKTICYNFMPILDWTRTELSYELETGGTALRFDMVKFICYDIYILERQGAANDYPAELVSKAELYFYSLTKIEQLTLEKNIIAGLPGSDVSFSRSEVLGLIKQYDKINETQLRANLIAFLEVIIPVAESVGVNMCIHPDDPPFSLFGLPRIVKNIDDLEFIFNSLPAICNGLTLCTGSLGASHKNNLPEIAKRFSNRIHFAHLRNVKTEPDGSFIESEHLEGDVDMVEVISILINEQSLRKTSGRTDNSIPMRPDHGHRLIDDQNKVNLPGYSLIGRLKGLSELRGVIQAINHLGNSSLQTLQN